MESVSTARKRVSPIDGIARFIPPAARRPATAIPTLLALLTLSYVLWSAINPFPTFLPETDSTKIYTEDKVGTASVDHPKLDRLPDGYLDHFPSGQLPDALIGDGSLDKLSERLVDFLRRPILSHDAAKESMRIHCPLEISDKLVNPDQYQGNIEFWKNQVGEDVIVEKRAGLVKCLAGKLDQGEPVVWQEGLGSGRGIVMTAGNKDTVTRLIFQLRHLKHLGTKLPVEVFHYPGEMTNQAQRDEVEALGATIHEVRGISKSPGAWKNWQIKGLALLQSSFKEILSLDSDNAPLRDPSHLFHSQIYKEHGSAFWPDLSKDHPDNAIWRIMGRECTLDDWTFETGQFLVDKSGNEGLNMAALWLVSGMLDDTDRDFWMTMCGGDKDTFRWAWTALGLEFGRSPRWMSSVGVMDRDQYCGHTVLQYDLDILPGETRPRPLFAHSNLLKHLGAWGLHRGSVFTHTKRLSLDTYSLNALNYARQWVKNGRRGMCLDIEWHELAEDRLSDEERKEFEIELVPVSDIEGGVFEGFEDSFFDLGGKVGGW